MISWFVVRGVAPCLAWANGLHSVCSRSRSPECRLVSCGAIIATILTPEIISRLRVIFRFYKTLHFPVDPDSGFGTTAGALEDQSRLGGPNQAGFGHAYPEPDWRNLLIYRC